ncbi:Transposon Tf2-6 polyprotein [Caligus rogercresseyi]|uniref:Transposon Tf2-6 polyprotein n=1 Tax=Caligus rogercresseyi TaxID=217165 RepID=A0A7T8KLN8_CALRO|nr:Transposon Tf2-6 polyprotein [Caligus rogercresseyi]
MYPCRVPAEEVAQIPPGMTQFTVLDGRNGYWQVLLDKPSSKIMTFNTHGDVPLPEECHGTHLRRDEFNRRGDDAIARIPNVKKIVEDIIIYDKDEDTHLQRVKEVIQRCDEHGITLGGESPPLQNRAYLVQLPNLQRWLHGEPRAGRRPHQVPCTQEQD